MLLHRRRFPYTQILRGSACVRIGRITSIIVAMIPEFPSFKKIELTDRTAIEAHTRKYPPYSDFNFTSLWSWDSGGKRGVSRLRNNLVVRFTDYQTQSPFLSFLGTHKVEETVRELLAYAKDMDMRPALHLVPEIVINEIDIPAFKVVCDQDNCDYVYLVSALAHMPGGAYKSKRVLAKKFTEQQPNVRFEMRNLHRSGLHTDIVSVIRSWEKNKSVNRRLHNIAHEDAAIQRLLKMPYARNVMIGAVFIDEVMEAFTIEEIVPHKYSIGHFWKTGGTHPGAYEFLAQKTAQYLGERGVIYWNWEQDLGLESLRFSKTSYRPSDFLKKYTVSLAHKN